MVSTNTLDTLQFYSSGAGASGGSGSSDVSPTDPFTEHDIKALTSMGFNRKDVIEALRETQGNVPTATATLCAKSLKF